MPPNDQHIHHLHNFDDYHYDISDHDHYPRHHHQWSGNNHFDTVNDQHDFDCCADDHNITTGPDHNHPGYDIRWADNHSRTSSPGNHPATT